eukprot:CAMPEP_0174873296 /NCGR_PEP_ID=MMETSP1114-20130205/74667_1 /TAXON_ID=312471 /ORGANISM="Neobodo designis, Strain CCAP 1951/1" /LENGTH=261 /DNA_ID=CAMNT_0016108611 /DNA_START=40 /DNA_END=821 /DNA_ORIENTATION=+
MVSPVYVEPPRLALNSAAVWHLYLGCLIAIGVVAIVVFVAQFCGLHIRTGVLSGTQRGGWCLTNRARMQSDVPEFPTVAELRNALERSGQVLAAHPDAPKFADVYVPKTSVRAEVFVARATACWAGSLIAFYIDGVTTATFKDARLALSVVLVLAVDAPLYFTRRESMRLRSPTFAQIARAASDRYTVTEVLAGMLATVAATLYVMSSTLAITAGEHPLAVAVGGARGEKVVFGVRILACIVALFLSAAAACARHREVIAV